MIYWIYKKNVNSAEQVMEKYEFMKYDLINVIKLNTEMIFVNADILLQTCDLDYILCDMPIWKHIYHMLHSLDQWYINPNEYTHPPFHTENLNSLDIASDFVLSREQLKEYLSEIAV